MNEKDKALIEQLKQLPKVEDQQNKSLLFEKIDQQMKGVGVTKKNSQAKWIVPSIAGAVIASLIFILIQTGMFNQDQMTEQSSDLEIRTSELIEQDAESNDIGAVDQEESVAPDETESFAENKVADDREPGNQLVYYNDEYQFPIYNLAVTDQQAQYLIPISLVDTATTPEVDYPNDVYNNISNMIDLDKLGVSHFPFEGIEFIFSPDRQQITMVVADDYQFPAGSTQAALFQMTVNHMFADYPATALNLETASADSIDLGPIGHKSSLEIEPVRQLAFKIYQIDNKERLLISLENNIAGDQFYTIDEALLEMQYDQAEFGITGTIPADVEYTVDPSDENTLRINFEADRLFGDNRQTKEMIEAILMTAKSFEFDQVEIELGEAISQINQFDLTKPIPVPDAVNPQMLH